VEEAETEVEIEVAAGAETVTGPGRDPGLQREDEGDLHRTEACHHAGIKLSSAAVRDKFDKCAADDSRDCVNCKNPCIHSKFEILLSSWISRSALCNIQIPNQPLSNLCLFS